MECEESYFSKQGWLAAWLSHEFQLRGNWTTSCPIFSCSALVGMTLQLLACLAREQLLATCSRESLARSSRESLFFLYTLEHFFTLSHSLHLQESHLNTGLLIAKIQANLAQNKTNKMVDKIQPYNLPLWLFHDKTLKQTLDLTYELGTVEHNSLTPNSRNCDDLESYEHESPETQQYIMIIVCRKAWNAYEASRIWSSKDGVKKQTMTWPKKQSLQGSDHNVHSHLEWTLGHTS